MLYNKIEMNQLFILYMILFFIFYFFTRASIHNEWIYIDTTNPKPPLPTQPFPAPTHHGLFKVDNEALSLQPLYPVIKRKGFVFVASVVTGVVLLLAHAPIGIRMPHVNT